MVFPDSYLHPPQSHSTINIEDVDGDSVMSHADVANERGTWFIPRPALRCDTTTCTCNSSERQANSSRSIQTVSEWLSPSTSSTPSSSKSSTQSGSSGTLLLTAANLAALRLEHQTTKPSQYDTESLASSTHFTVVNGMSRKPHAKTADCCRTCHRHQLTALVVSVCGLFLVGLCLAIYYIDMRARGALS